MYAAAAWLVWVLAQQAGPRGLARCWRRRRLAAWPPGSTAFAGARRRGGEDRLAGPARHRRPVAVGCLAPPSPCARAAAAAAAAAASPRLCLRALHPARLAALRAEGKPVFVNFTAAWCVTCQVNERSPSQRRVGAEAFRRTGVVYLVADWTNRDAVIAGPGRARPRRRAALSGLWLGRRRAEGAAAAVDADRSWRRPDTRGG